MTADIQTDQPKRVRVYGSDRRSAHRALEDLKEGFGHWRLWTAMGWQDIQQRYRRAFIGPFWITISMGILVVALGVIYAGLFRIETAVFLPHIATGFIVWFYFSSSINDATAAFIDAEGIIKDGGRPLSLHILRVCYRNLIIAGHNVAVMIAVYAWQPKLLTVNILYLIPGLIFFILNILWISFVIATLCTRFRDVPPIVSNVVQMLFFVSPVMYKRDSLPDSLSFVVDYNPVAYLLEILRSPLQGNAPDLTDFVVVIGLSIAGSLFAFRFFQVTRARVAYWL
ncbi:ABC transporter permease [Roseobacter sp.]|uniref:ABC transporter permease n=1 Tax=Roseobacter sp. TaxID=1907202 RepID=UPI003297C6BE